MLRLTSADERSRRGRWVLPAESCRVTSAPPWARISRWLSTAPSRSSPPISSHSDRASARPSARTVPAERRSADASDAAVLLQYRQPAGERLGRPVRGAAVIGVDGDEAAELVPRNLGEACLN